MKKIFTVLTLTILMFSCSSKKEGNMTVQGTIKGLKKGTLYLQKMKDTVLVSVDSVDLLGDEKFILTDNVEYPELFYLTFDGNTTDKRILFFGEKGIITINDEVENFGLNPEISGSKNQEILDKYFAYSKRFQDERLDFIKKEFDARRDNNDSLIKQLELDYNRLQRLRVLFTTNFAISNANSEVAPYLGLTEMYDASIKMLDTVNNSLSDEIKNSVYGKRFQKYLEDIKTAESNEKQ